MDMMGLIVAAAGGYLLGSIPFGLLLTRWAGLGDIRAVGSGNIGATNVLRTGRRDIALATLALDAGKAAIALVLARTFIGFDAGLIAGACAFLGHCFPIWLGFRGGKGVATFFGVLLAGVWPLGLLAGAVWIGVALTSRYSSLAALGAAALAPLAAAIGGEDLRVIAFCALLGALIFVRHRENIGRLLAGTETRIGARGATMQTPPEA